MRAIKLAIAGVGNCASALVQGIQFYRRNPDSRSTLDNLGLMHLDIGGWGPSDIEVVAAFDVDSRKVGKPLGEAIFAKPNCACVIAPTSPAPGCPVRMGPVLDGVAPHMLDYPENDAFRISTAEPVDVTAELRRTAAEILVCYLPTGADNAVKHYAQCALDAGVAFVNCVPVFVASDPEWARRFAEARLPIIGDDVKSQLGATVLHRVIADLFEDRGCRVDRTYQLNVGGNTDFLNMKASERIVSKKISKTEAVQSRMTNRLEAASIHIAPSDYVRWQGDNKVAFIRVEGRGYGSLPIELDIRLSVQDSANSAGVVIDCVRFAKLALDREWFGALDAVSARYMKSPPVEMPESDARRHCEDFLRASSSTPC